MRNRPVSTSQNPGEWKEYLNINLVLDDLSLDTIPADTYEVVVQFMVDKEGKLDDIKIAMDPGYGLGKKVKDVIWQYKERWIPAVFNSHPASSYQKQPIIFTVE